MAGTQVLPPFPIFTDIDGSPLDDGLIHVGQAPEGSIPSLFWDRELTVPTTSPIQTIDGYPSNAGVRSRFYSSEPTYSITVVNKHGTVVYQSPSYSSSVEWSRSQLTSAINTSSEMLNSQSVSIWEFAEQATGYSPGGDPNAWDWADALQAFLNAAGDLVLTEGFTYNTSKTLQLRSNTRLTINGTLRFMDQSTTLSSEHLLQAGALGDPRSNIAITGFGTIDGNYQGRDSFEPTSGAYLFLGREVDGLIICGDRLKWINAPTSAITGVQCSNVTVKNNDVRNIREHGVYFSTDSTGLTIVNNNLNDLGVENLYDADAIKLRNNCSFFIVSGNKVNDTATVTTSVVRGVVLDESDNVSPIVHAVCHDGLVCDNLMFHLSTGIWCKGSLIDSAEADSFFQMNVEFTGNTFAAKSSGSLFAGILEKVRRVDVKDNKFLNFTAGVYGGGVGDIDVIDNTIRNRNGSSGDGIRMLDTEYNDTAVPSRLRGNVKLKGNKVSGYNGVGILMTVANAVDDISGNDVVSQGRAINYVDFNLATAPLTGKQITNVSNNPRLESTTAAVVAVFMNSRAVIPVEHTVADNGITSLGTGLSFSILQNSAAINNKISAPVHLSFGAGTNVYRAGNYSESGPIANVLNVAVNRTFSSLESGVTAHNEGATTTRTYTWPAAVPGLEFTFLRVATFPLRGDPDGTDTIRGGGAGKYVQLNADGDFVKIKCMVAGTWEIVEFRGTFTFEP